MSYSSNISISVGTLPIYVASFALRLPYGERRPLLVRFRVRRNYSNRCPPYVLKILRRSDLGGPAIFQNLPHLFFLLNVLFLAKPVCQNLVHMTRGVPENSSSFNLRIAFNSSILFKILSLFA